MVSTQTKSIKVYIVEEQELYRELYKTVLRSRSPFELLHISDNDNVKTLSQSIISLRPDVILISTKRLDEDTVNELERIRTACPRTGIILLLVFHNTRDAELLRQLAVSGSGGIAILLKQSLDDAEQLYSMLTAVSQGQVILDPMLTNMLLSRRPEYPLLKQLTARELEILSMLANGYTNAAIAETLFIDLKTVEHHINSMYSKLKTLADFGSKHPRVSAARFYLEATGELPVTVQENT